MGVLRFDGDDKVRWTTLATALSNVSDGRAYTMAWLLRTDDIQAGADYEAIGYLLSGTGAGTARAGLSIRNNDVLNVDANADPQSTLSLADSTIYIVVVRFDGEQWTFDRYTRSSTTWATPHTPATTDIESHVAATILEIAAWQGSDFFDGWIGLVGIWDGRMSDAQVTALDDNWATSDWYNHAFGTPEFLCEMNVAGTSLVDLAGNATDLAVTGTSLDTGETLDSWNFDGTGSGGTELTPASLTRTRAQGGPTVSPQAIPASLTRTRALGTPVVSPTVLPASLSRTRALGDPTVTFGITISPDSLTRTRALGTPTTSPTVLPGSQTRTRALGDPTVSVTGEATPTALVHTRAIGTPTISASVLPASLTRTRTLGGLDVDDGIADIITFVHTPQHQAFIVFF